MLQRSPAGRVEFVELLPDRSTALRRLHHFAFKATSARCVLSSPGRLGSLDHALLDLMAVAGERRRLLIDPLLARSPATEEQATRLQLEVRVRPGSALQALVFDDGCAALPLDPSDLNVGVVMVRGALAAPYGQLFELMWLEAAVPGTDSLSDTDLSRRQLEIIRLLLDGATDHQVATRLGMSSRTVRAVVAQLQERFGTRSRMALGFQLAREHD